jgi:hypothetical protein
MSFLLRNKFRLPLFLAGIAGALFAPAWVPLLCMGLLAFRYRAPEVLALGLIMDFLWLAPSTFGILSALPLFTLAGLVLVWGLEPLRSEFLLPEPKS